jgi:hypothetical protein
MDGSVADPGSGAFLTPGSGRIRIRDEQSGSGSATLAGVAIGQKWYSN